MLDLGALRSFAEVAERGTVAAAATARGYTAPAVSQHLAKLETELGAELFDRAGPRLRLTDAGRALVPIAHAMIDLDEQARAAVHRPAVGPRPVVIAGFASAIRTVLIPRLGQIGAAFAPTILELEDAAALRDLRLGALDVVLTQEYDHLPAERDDRLDYRPLLTDRLRLVLSPGTPSASTIEQLGATPWLLNGHDTRCADATRHLLREAGIDPTIDAVVADNGALLALVEAGRGVTVVPESVLGEHRGDLVVADRPLAVTRAILAVTRRAATPSWVGLLDALATGAGSADPGASAPRTARARSGSGRRRARPTASSPHRR